MRQGAGTALRVLALGVLCGLRSCLARAVEAQQQRSLLVEWSRELDGGSENDAKLTPIQRVVKLLTEMKTQLEEEAANDQEAYDKMVCWCDTNEKEKTKAISDAEAKIQELESDVAEAAAKDAELDVKITATKKDLAKKKEALATATALREKEYAEFTDEEKEMVQTVTILKNAIQVLSKHQGNLLQLPSSVQESLGSALRWVALKHDELKTMQMEGKGLRGQQAPLATSGAALLSLGQGSAAADAAFLGSLMQRHHSPGSELPVQFAARVLAAEVARGATFMQQHEEQPVDHFEKKPAGYGQSYHSQSSGVFGILTTMKEEFEANLSEAQKEELKAQADFKELKAASEKAIDSLAAALDDMEEEYGTNKKTLSDAKEDLEMTTAQRSEDVKFLTDLKVKCKALDYDWKKRSEGRGEELKAVTETIGILQDDDNREHLNRMSGASFVQLQKKAEGAAHRAARSRAAAVLLQAADKLKVGRQLPDEFAGGDYEVWKAGEEQPHERLSTLAVQVQLDAFTKVKQAIDDMIVELKGQQEEEVKQKAFCTDGLNENEKETYKTEQVLKDLMDKIGSLEDKIQKLADDIESAKDQIAEMEVQLKTAGEARKKENLVFRQEVSDQKAMQDILTKALSRMRQVYKKALFVQLKKGPEPPVQFQPYKQNKNASPVISMIESIIEDSKKDEKEAIQTENDAQKAYADFVSDSTASIKGLRSAIESKTKAKSANEVEKEETEAEAQATHGQIEDLYTAAADLHRECDFLMKNFDIRQKARLQEIEALGNAKAYLSGMQDDQ